MRTSSSSTDPARDQCAPRRTCPPGTGRRAPEGGDPFVLGRGGEEALHCAAHGIAVEVVPGITSVVSVPAAAGIPVTHRGMTASFVVASGHDGAAAALDGLRAAPPSTTLVLLMGVKVLATTSAALIVVGEVVRVADRVSELIAR